MVHRKQQHSKSKKKPHGHVLGKQGGKRQGNAAGIGGDFRSQLDALGLKIIQVTSDGNCFFRALADQLEGNEEEHQKYRNVVLQYILKHREDFEPFIEDEVPFDEYCNSMAKDGTWAGNLELQAASLVTSSNICIHRIMEPRWYIRNFNSNARIIHLSYHNEEHYNSVRLKEDPCNRSAKPILIQADAGLSATSREVKSVLANEGLMKLVMAGSGCENANKVEQVLREVDGDVNAAIEFLIAEQESDHNIVENDEHLINMINGHSEIWESKPTELAREEYTCERDGSDTNNIKSTSDHNKTQHIDKNIPRNKLCICGSKKKHKSCCGSAKRNSSPEFVINQRVASGKSKTQGKQNRKGGPTNVAPSELNLPDMGALCI